MARSSVDSIPDADRVIKPGAVVLLRADLNVPLSASAAVLDDARVVAAVPTILYLTSRGAKVLLLTHMGRPKNGQREPGLTTDALVPVLEAALKKATEEAGAATAGSAPSVPPVTKIDDCVGPLVAATAASCPDGAVVLLENVRFHAGEEKNDRSFAEELAGGVGGKLDSSFPPSPPLQISLYVNDAFGAAHRAHASTEGVARVLRERGVPCVAGLLLRSELAKLGRVLCCPRRPLVALVGGSKASTKLATIERLAGHADAVELMGAWRRRSSSRTGGASGRAEWRTGPSPMRGTCCSGPEPERREGKRKRRRKLPPRAAAGAAAARRKATTSTENRPPRRRTSEKNWLRSRCRSTPSPRSP